MRKHILFFATLALMGLEGCNCKNQERENTNQVTTMNTTMNDLLTRRSPGRGCRQDSQET